MDDEKNKTTPSDDDNNVISLDDSRNQNRIDETQDDAQQPFKFEGSQDQYSFDNDKDTQDLLRALQQGEISYNDVEYNGYEVETDADHQEIPVTAAEKTEEIQKMVAAMAGEFADHPVEDEDEDEDEDEGENLEEEVASEPDKLPDMEIKDEVEDSQADQVANETEIEKPNNSSDKDNLSHEDSTSDKILSDESNDGSDAEAEEDEAKRKRQLDEEQTLQPGNPQQPMAQTNLAGGLGHAFGSVINGVFSGIGMALGSGLAAVSHTKAALSAGTGEALVSNKIEAGAHFHFSPASQAVNDSFNENIANDWKQNRIDTEFASLQMDVDAHLRSVDKLRQTEWAQKLKSIEESGDPELIAKAPAILNMAKAKSDFKDIERDMSYFQEHIQQRAEHLSSMINDSQVGCERLENVMIKWQEEAKKRLDDLPDAKEKQGILERIQNSAQNVMAGLRSLFSSSKSASMG
jgi:hypothetical protein